MHFNDIITVSILPPCGDADSSWVPLDDLWVDRIRVVYNVYFRELPSLLSFPILSVVEAPLDDASTGDSSMDSDGEAPLPFSDSYWTGNTGSENFSSCASLLKVEPSIVVGGAFVGATSVKSPLVEEVSATSEVGSLAVLMGIGTGGSGCDGSGSRAGVETARRVSIPRGAKSSPALRDDCPADAMNRPRTSRDAPSAAAVDCARNVADKAFAGRLEAHAETRSATA